MQLAFSVPAQLVEADRCEGPINAKPAASG